MAVYALGSLEPSIDSAAYVHPDSVIIGDVTLGPEASVWPSAVLRGDDGAIVVGARTSIQDGSIIHTTAVFSTHIGEECVVGHAAHMEGCTVHDRSLIGSGSILLHRVVVGPDAVVGANAVATGGLEVPPHASALGVPATVRPDSVDPGHIAIAMQSYVDRAKRFRRDLRRLD